ncbi:hypothetical protein MY11210_002449 [Beauveria gryllotalpidicola]
MGTRHLIVVVFNGRWYLAQYGQWDGYPEVVGMRLVRLLCSPGLVPDLRAGLPHTYVPADDAEMQRLWHDANDACQILDHEPIFDRVTGEVRRSEFGQWLADPLARYTPELLDMLPSLHRDTSAAVLVLAARATAARPLPVCLEPEFANDGFSCEWAYVVDLDAEVLEVYEGATRKTPGHRFEHIGPAKASVPTFIVAVPFGELDKYKDDREGFAGMVNDEIEAINERAAAARKSSTSMEQ